MLPRRSGRRLVSWFRKSLLHCARPRARRLSNTKHAAETLEDRLLLTVDFQFNYTGAPAANTGFNERVNGDLTATATARRAALESIASDFGALFATDTTLVVDVLDWFEPGEGWLAEVNDIFPARTAGFENRTVANHKVITGEDLNGSTGDGRLGVNWGENHELDPDDVGAGEDDFYATIFHEFGHMIGFTAQINENGTPALGATNRWAPFDQFVADNSGVSLINSETLAIDQTRWNASKEGNTSNGLFFNGPNAAFYHGGLIPLYSPSGSGGFDISSSVSHVDDDAPGIHFTTHLMVSNGVSGQANAHEFHPDEVGIFKDLGFQYIGPNSLDFGDAPDAGAGNGAGDYDTLVASNGPRHIVYPDLKIGAAIDYERAEASPNAGATGDDNDADDEDGITSVLTAAEETAPVVTVSITNNRGTEATLYGWIDYNADGVFGTSERASAAVPTGTNSGSFELTFPSIPSGSARNTFARFRLSTDVAAAVPTGLALDGEVEDYAFSITGPITVTTGADENDGTIDPGTGAGTSLREAIAYANVNPGTEIRFAPGVSNVLLTSDLFVAANMSISGSGADSTTIDGQDSSSVFVIVSTATVEISDITITNGKTLGDGGAILNDGDLTLRNSKVTSSEADYGGAIFNFGTLTVVDSTFSDNTANNGGAIFSEGTATIERSTLNNNTAAMNGGAIANGNQLTLRNVTISGNTANENGGGIENSAALTVINSTIVNNRANADGLGNEVANGDGGGILTNAGIDSTPSSLTIHNSIVANNNRGGFQSEPSDISEASNNIVASSQNNLIGVDTGFTSIADGANGNLIGKVDDILDPRVAELADNGGPTQTHALLQVSRAIDAGANSVATANNLTVDQRGTGFDRVRGDSVDIGAFEGTPHTPMTFTVSTSADESDGDFSDGDLSLREAIEQANANSGLDTINFSSELTGQAINLVGSGLTISDNVTITGPGASRLTISGGNAVTPFTVGVIAEAEVSGLKITEGQGNVGGAILNDGLLTLSQVIVTDSNATIEGGGIANLGILNIDGSSVTNNSAGQFGGGIENRGTVTIVNGTISGNSANEIGGGMENFNAATIINTTIANNRVNANGMAGGLAGAASRRGTFVLEMHNTIVADNFVGSGAEETRSDLVEFSAQITSDSSHNLIGAASLLTATFLDGDMGNVIGLPQSPVVANLAGLVTIGGFPIHELQPGSPAIDGGSNDEAIGLDGTQLSLDQTGFRRIFDGNEDSTVIVDMGPFEYVTRTGPTTVNAPTGETSDATPEITWDAVNLANSYDVIVTNSAGQQVIFETVSSTTFTPTDPLTAGTYNVRVRSLRDIDGIFINGAFSPSVAFAVTVPSIVVSETDGSTVVTESGGTDTISVKLGAEPTTDVNLIVESSDTGEATASPPTLTFNSSNWNLAQTVTVTGQPDDEIADGDVTSTVTIAVDAAHSDAAFLATLPQTVSVVTQSHSAKTVFQLNGRGRATDFVTLESTTGNNNLDVELRAPDGTVLSPGADGRVSLAGYPAGIYEIWVNDEAGNVDVTPSDNLGQAAGEPDAPAVDLDGNGEFQFSNDGIILLAYAFGARGEGLEAHRGVGDARTGDEISLLIEQLADAIDFDGDGNFVFSNDGILLLAYAFGSRDNALDAFRSAAATRDPASVSSRLEGVLASANTGNRQQSPEQSESAQVSPVVIKERGQNDPILTFTPNSPTAFGDSPKQVELPETSNPAAIVREEGGLSEPGAGRDDLPLVAPSIEPDDALILDRLLAHPLQINL